MFETEEDNDFYTAREKNILRKKLAVQKKADKQIKALAERGDNLRLVLKELEDKIRYIEKETQNDDKKSTLELSKAAQDKIIRKLMQIHFPFEPKQIKLLLGFALYGMELFEKADQDPEAKKEIVTRMKKCDEYFKEFRRKKAEQKRKEISEETVSAQSETVESSSLKTKPISSAPNQTTTHSDDAITWQ